jgi:hypothetical protein
MPAIEQPIPIPILAPVPRLDDEDVFEVGVTATEAEGGGVLIGVDVVTAEGVEVVVVERAEGKDAGLTEELEGLEEPELDELELELELEADCTRNPLE